MKISGLFSAFAAALLLTGCVNDFNEDDYVSLTPGLTEQVELDNEFSGDIRIIQTTQIRTEGDVLGVSVRCRVKRAGFLPWLFESYKPVQLSYKFTWFGADGKEAETDHPQDYIWHTVSIYPGEEFSCNSHAPDKTITKVKLVIKRGAGTAPAAAAKPVVHSDDQQKAEAAKNPPTTAQPVSCDKAASTDSADKVSAIKELQGDLPAAVREGKATTTDSIKDKTAETDRKALELKDRADSEIRAKTGVPADGNANPVPASDNGKKASSKPCMCGCANGEPCYCPEGSGCPNAGKYKKTETPAK